MWYKSQFCYDEGDVDIMMMVMMMWTLVWIDFQIHSAGSPSKKDHLDNIFFSGRKESR